MFFSIRSLGTAHEEAHLRRTKRRRWQNGEVEEETEKKVEEERDYGKEPNKTQAVRSSHRREAPARDRQKATIDSFWSGRDAIHF